MPDLDVIALLTPAPGQAEAVSDALAGLVVPSRAEETNRRYEVRRVTGDQPRFVVLERWRDEAAFDTHLRQPHMTAFLARAEHLLAGPPEVLMLGADPIG